MLKFRKSCHEASTMLAQYQHLVRNVRPISILRQDVPTGSRIGGAAPAAIAPLKAHSFTRYFATISSPGPDGQEISLYTSLDYYDETSNYNLYRNVSRIFSSEDFVQVVIHPKSKRGDSPLFASELPGPRASNRTGRLPTSSSIRVENCCYRTKSGGGLTFTMALFPDIESTKALFEQGFFLLLQMTWGGYERSVPCSWPFDEYTFHLLGKETSGGITWRYGWG